MGRPIVNHINETNISFYGQKMTIIRYNGCNDIDVEFEDNYVSRNRTYTDFKLNRITNYNYPSVFNVGIIGKDNEVGFSKSKSYRCWVNMLNRCYNEKYKKINQHITIVKFVKNGFIIKILKSGLIKIIGK